MSRGCCAPNLLLAGTQKAGTTYLARMLAMHPDVFFSKPKEVFFFGTPDVTNDTYQEYLQRYFSADTIEAANRGCDVRIRAEGSTTYFQSPLALQNITKCLGRDFKAIVVMRHPVEKALSFYMRNYRRQRHDSSRAVNDAAIVRTGLYAKHLRRWIDDLGFERFCPMKFDSLQDSPLEFVNTAARFIGLAPLRKVVHKKINAGFEMIRRGDYVEPTMPDKSLQTTEAPRFAIKDLVELQKYFLPDIKKLRL